MEYYHSLDNKYIDFIEDMYEEGMDYHITQVKKDIYHLFERKEYFYNRFAEIEHNKLCKARELLTKMIGLYSKIESCLGIKIGDKESNKILSEFDKLIYNHKRLLKPQ